MIGCDIVEIERIQKSIDKFGDKFLEMIMTNAELELYRRKGMKAEFVAGRFSAKEAVSKAIGTGISGTLSFTDIEILPDEAGRPEVYLHGKKQNGFSVSISHSRYNAIAVCSIEEA